MYDMVFVYKTLKLKLLTVNSIHLTSLAAPKHPKNDKIQTIADVATKTYTAPENKFVPNKSFTKLLSIIVHRPRPNTTAPPIYKI